MALKVFFFFQKDWLKLQVSDFCSLFFFVSSYKWQVYYLGQVFVILLLFVDKKRVKNHHVNSKVK